MVFFTQITMEAAEDPEFLDGDEARRTSRARWSASKSVTPEGLKDVYKDFNYAGEQLVDRLRAFRQHGVHVLGSFIFGLPSDRPETFDATAALAERAGITFAQFVMLTPFPGTVDFAAWEKIDGVGPDAHRRHAAHAPLADSRQALRPKVYTPHPSMSADDIRARHAGRVGSVLQPGATSGRARSCVESLKSRLAFVLISKLYRQMYANTGIATDSARINRSATLGAPDRQAAARSSSPASRCRSCRCRAGSSSELRVGV